MLISILAQITLVVVLHIFSPFIRLKQSKIEVLKDNLKCIEKNY